MKTDMDVRNLIPDGTMSETDLDFDHIWKNH